MTDTSSTTKTTENATIESVAMQAVIALIGLAEIWAQCLALITFAVTNPVAWVVEEFQTENPQPSTAASSVGK